MITLTQAAVWVIVGLAVGSLVGYIVKGQREGFGVLANLGIGLAGAVVGGLIFELVGLFPNLDQISISLRDVVAAVAGSFIVLLALWLYRRYGTSPS